MPINSNHVFDNTGSRYNVTKILDAAGHFDNDKYQQYSEPYMAAGNLTIYFWFLAIYTCSELSFHISYVGRRELTQK